MQLKSITAITVLLLVVASLLIAGCTSSTSPTATPTAQQATVAPTAIEATPAPTVAPSKPSAAGFVVVEVNSITTSNQLGSYPLGSTPSPGKTYVVFDVTLTNQNKNNLYMGNPSISN